MSVSMPVEHPSQRNQSEAYLANNQYDIYVIKYLVEDISDISWEWFRAESVGGQCVCQNEESQVEVALVKSTICKWNSFLIHSHTINTECLPMRTKKRSNCKSDKDLQT